MRSAPLCTLGVLCGTTVISYKTDSVEPARAVNIYPSNVCILLQSCIKPHHQEVKLELELDMQSPNYDTSRGEQIAWNVDGVAGNKDERKTEEKFFKK